ncbi:G patch domain-containing protein 8 [Amia ocellicauda]|uniref:G patch domain-containing protein 8 n=1 Tax=Amia ocellicauda TaxID=2972642 RepID=UPI003464DCB4
MACYYLVISSTHLSNGHFRSIKGVFRGPLCKTPGSESPDYAEKEKAISKALEDLKANFYCELCDKQYHKHQEFDNHINSYDHAHKQRLKELKHREFARNVASKSWKDEKKQEKALRRLHQLAELRKQSESGPGSGPKFRATTVAAESQRPENLFSERDRGVRSHHIHFTPGDRATDASCRGPQERPTPREQNPVSDSRPGPPRPAPDYSSQRAGVSFCFSKKAQLKLESSASVFSDNTEEAGDRDALTHRGKPGLDGFRAYVSSMADCAMDVMVEEGQEDEEKCLETEQNPSAQAATQNEEPGFPLMVIPDSLELLDLDQRLRELIADPGTNSTELDQTGCSTERETDCKDAAADGGPIHLQRKSLILEHLQMDPSSEPVCIQDTEETIDLRGHMVSSVEVGDVERLGKERGEPDGPPNKKTGPFLNVLNKDRTTMLKWPSELLLYTKTEPFVSYSCNPLYFDFKHSRNKQKAHADTNRAGEDCCLLKAANAGNTDAGTEHRSLGAVELQSHKPPEHKLDSFKPKKGNFYKACKSPKPHSEAASRASTCCKHNVSPQLDPAGTETAAPDTSHSKHTRSRIGKRKRSVKEETSNKSNTAEQSKNGLINSPGDTLGKNKKRKILQFSAENHNKDVSSEQAPTKTRPNSHSDDNNRHFKCDSSTSTHREESGSQPPSDKSGSGSSFSDLETDSEGGSWGSGGSSSSCGSSFSLSSKRGSSCSETLGREFCCQSSDESSCAEAVPGGAREHGCHQDHRGAHRRKRKKHASSSENSSGTDGPCRKRSRRLRTTTSRHSSQHSHSSYSSQSSGVSDESRDRQSSSRWWFSSGRRRHHSDKSGAKPQCSPSHSGSPGGRRPSQEGSRSFSRDQIFSLKPPVVSCNRKMLKEAGIASRTQSNHDPLTKAARNSPNVSVVPPRLVERLANRKGSPGKKGNNAAALPLIGKFPAVKRHVKKVESDRVRGNLGKPHGEAADSSADLCKGQSPLSIDKGTDNSPSAPSRKHSPEADGQDPTGGPERGALPGPPPCETAMFTMHSVEREPNVPPNPSANSFQEPPASIPQTGHPRAAALQGDSTKCPSPPLSEQPITYSPDEIDKYRRLQLQAQQHMQQQLLGKPVKVLPAPAEVHSFTPAMPSFQPMPLQPAGPVTSIQQALLQHRAMAAFTSTLGPHAVPPALAHLHPLPQAHFAPLSLSPLGPALFPAHPAALLAGHPFHLVPASSFHPAHLALHPLPHGTLLPALLTPSPGLQLHPLLHPLFPGHDLPPHSGHSS